MGFPCLLLWWNSFTPVNTLFVFFLCLLYVILPIGFGSFLTGVEWVRVRFRSTAQWVSHAHVHSLKTFPIEATAEYRVACPVGSSQLCCHEFLNPMHAFWGRGGFYWRSVWIRKGPPQWLLGSLVRNQVEPGRFQKPRSPLSPLLIACSPKDEHTTTSLVQVWTFYHQSLSAGFVCLFMPGSQLLGTESSRPIHVIAHQPQWVRISSLGSRPPCFILLFPVLPTV